MSESAGRNVLVVVLDTVRKDHLTPYGYDRPTTPTLSAFADEALVYEEAVVAVRGEVVLPDRIQHHDEDVPAGGLRHRWLAIGPFRA